MRRCLNCSTIFPTDGYTCPNCGTEPIKLNGFTAYASELAEQNSGFKASYFANLAPLEAKHFWFRARNRLIAWALEKYCPNFKSFLEIGCGTGYVLSGIAKLNPKARLEGSEIFTSGLTFAASRLPNVNFMQLDARNIPFSAEFDVIGAFDVLEHIEEDVLVMRQINESLKPQGVMLLTVPQHQWLWSPVDNYACHVRRYSAAELHAKVMSAGFEILRSSSFVSSLLPVMYVSRMLQRRTTGNDLNSTSELIISPWLNQLLERVLLLEIAMIRSGISFPIGGSRLIVARKI